METLSDYIRNNPPQGFKPIPYYSEVGDFISVYFYDLDCYAEQVNPQLTIYRSNKNGLIVGCKISGIKNLTKGKTMKTYEVQMPNVDEHAKITAGRFEITEQGALVFDDSDGCVAAFAPGHWCAVEEVKKGKEQ